MRQGARCLQTVIARGLRIKEAKTSNSPSPRGRYGMQVQSRTRSLLGQLSEEVTAAFATQRFCQPQLIVFCLSNPFRHMSLVMFSLSRIHDGPKPLNSSHKPDSTSDAPAHLKGPHQSQKAKPLQRTANRATLHLQFGSSGFN